jgi:hypothetical protein
VAEFHQQHELEPGVADGWNGLIEAYHRTSAVWNLADRIDGPPEVPSAARPVDAEVVGNALDVYRRSIRLVTGLVEEHGSTVRFFWQPRLGGWPAEILDHLPDEVIDVSDVFAGQESERYIDTVHTDEEGAALLAERLWAELEPDLEALAADD